MLKPADQIVLFFQGKFIQQRNGSKVIQDIVADLDHLPFLPCTLAFCRSSLLIVMKFILKYRPYPVTNPVNIDFFPDCKGLAWLISFIFPVKAYGGYPVMHQILLQVIQLNPHVV